MCKFFGVVMLTSSMMLVGCDDDSSSPFYEGTDERNRAQEAEISAEDRPITEKDLALDDISEEDVVTITEEREALEQMELSFSSCLMQASVTIPPASDGVGYIIHLGSGKYYRLSWEKLDEQGVEHNEKYAPLAMKLRDMSNEAQDRALASRQHMAVMQIRSMFQKHGERVDINNLPGPMKSAEVDRQSAVIREAGF